MAPLETDAEGAAITICFVVGAADRFTPRSALPNDDVEVDRGVDANIEYPIASALHGWAVTRR